MRWKSKAKWSLLVYSVKMQSYESTERNTVGRSFIPFFRFCQITILWESGTPYQIYSNSHVTPASSQTQRRSTASKASISLGQKSKLLVSLETYFNLERICLEEQYCSTEDLYLCTYSKLCISSTLRCNGDVNCGYGVVDDTDEQHCRVIRF